MGKYVVHRKIKLVWFVAIALATVIAAPRTASAAPPTLERLQIELAPYTRYGLALESLDYNPWGPGMGGAIGYTLDNAIYLGGSFDWFNGEEIEYPDPGGRYKDAIYIGGNYWQALVWGGYDIELSKYFVFRPKVGVGMSTSTLKDCNLLIDNEIECLKTIQGKTSIAPAAQVLFVSPVLLSLEARFVMLFDSVTIKSAVVGGFTIGF